MYDAPGYVWALVLVGAIGIPLTTIIALYRGALAARMPRRTAVGVAAVAASILGGWFAVSSLIAGAGVYDFSKTPPWFGLAVAGILIALLLATAIPVVSRIFAAPGSLARLALPHTLRVLGIVFLILMAQGALPGAFAWPAGLGDIATGLAAPFLARELARGQGRRQAVWFNVFGLVDLIVALTLGALIGLGPFEIVPATETLAFLPLALIPTVAVPVAITLHVVSLRRLRAGARVKDRSRPMSIPIRERTLGDTSERARIELNDATFGQKWLGERHGAG